MVKIKQKPIAALLSKGNDSRNSFHDSSNVAADSELSGDDSWVVVKKQKVTILIPQLPSSKQCTLRDYLGLSRDQPHLNIPSSTNVTSAPPKLPHRKPHDTCLAEGNDGAMPHSPESDTRSSRNVHTSPDNAVSSPGSGKMDSRAHNADQDGVLNEIALASSRSFGNPEQSSASVPCCTAVLNKTMRASNVRMKITKAGGLHKWLSSLGLKRFERIFGGQHLNNFQVENLSMSKLKDMGYHAVGPRRKLIHAIECLCQ
ncbi:hypothetical protein vseg_016530 [Gypsophila vaccaria]